jgi:hypothetical protein
MITFPFIGRDYWRGLPPFHQVYGLTKLFERLSFAAPTAGGSCGRQLLDQPGHLRSRDLCPPAVAGANPASHV